MQEKERVTSKIGKEIILRIEHFGSTSIPKIKSKPYIDIMIEIPINSLFDKDLVQSFESLGYSYFKVPERDKIDAFMSFGKGYKTDGTTEQIFHIHMCPKNNIMWDQIGFRDYLNTNIERAKQYEELKLKLASKFKNDRGAYVLGKNDFVNETIELMKTSTQ
jgi:GrpB-like predicted nucleotidyltransferase (UPF0157 family)